jgi:hypothetical protein
VFGLLGVGVCPIRLKLGCEYKNLSSDDIKFPIKRPLRFTVYCWPNIIVVEADIVTTACGVTVNVGVAVNVGVIVNVNVGVTVNVGVAVNVGVGVLVNVGVIVGVGTRQISKLSIEP